jgi:very-short-patch-repair endonuclease
MGHGVRRTPARELAERRSTPETTFGGVPEDADELRRLLSWQHNVITLQQAVAHLSRGTVRHMVDSGRWRQVHAGIFSTHTGPLAADQRLWVASLAGGDGEPALLGGRTALGLLGLRGFEPDRIDVLIPARRRADRPPRNVVIHRTTSLPATDVLVRWRPPCTTAARSIVDAASWARTDREATTVVAMAFQQRLVCLDEVRAVVEQLPRAKRRRLTLSTAHDAAEGSHSLGEVEMARLLRRHRLPPPSRQAARIDAGGRRRYLDLFFEDYGLHVEIDGAHHLDAGQAWLDMDRQNQVWLSGERILRFPAWLVRQQPLKVATDIRRALEAAGWRR